MVSGFGKPPPVNKRVSHVGGKKVESRTDVDKLSKCSKQQLHSE